MTPAERIKRLALLITTAWTGIVGGSYYWAYQNENEQMIALADAEAKANLKRDLAFRLWSTSHGGIYLRVDEKNQPSPFLAHVPGRDVPDPNGGMLTLQNPAASLREIKAQQTILYGDLARITGLKYLNPVNAPDAWEIKALNVIAQTLSDYSEVTAIDGKPYLRRMQPMIMEEGCMKCHAWTGIKIGELRGATDIAIPLERYLPLAQEAQIQYGGTHLLIYFLGLVCVGYFTQRGLRHATESAEYQKTLEQLAQDEALRVIQQKAILNGANYSIIATGVDGLITSFNQAAERMLGYSADEMIGRQTPALIHDPEEVILRARELSDELGQEIMPGFKVFVAKADLLGIPDEQEWTYLRKDGSRFPVLLSVTALKNEQGELNGYLYIASDLSEKSELLEKLGLSEKVFTFTDEAIVITDSENRIILVNAAFSKMTGYALEEVVGRNPKLLSSGKHEPEFYRQMWATLLETGHWRGEIWDRRKDGSTYPKRMRLTIVREPVTGAIVNHIGIFSDVTQEKLQEDQIRHIAYHDALTGLPNRALFLDRLEVCHADARRQNLTFGLMFIDLDHFKNVNDTLGHHVGDLLLLEVSSRLADCVREVDTVARLGGDEFVVILGRLQNPHDAAAVAEKILPALSQPMDINGHEIHVSPSIGIAIYPNDAEDCDTLMKCADTAMYHAKNNGRANYKFFTAELNRVAQERSNIEQHLRKAIKQNQFELFYQPKIGTHPFRIVGCEALLRWRHPDRGLIGPDQFIPVAEDSGLILPMGEWVIGEVCRQINRWKEIGLVMPVALNVSGHQFIDNLLTDKVRAALAGQNIAPEMIEIEITESTLMNNAENAAGKLRALRALGISLAIDDFGTGYSSLAYLKNFSINTLKIDKSFIHDMQTDMNDAAIVRAVISLAHELGLKVVAEGVETAEQARLLVDQGCDVLQGFHFSKPLPADQFLTYLRKEFSTAFG